MSKILFYDIMNLALFFYTLRLYMGLQCSDSTGMGNLTSTRAFIGGI